MWKKISSKVEALEAYPDCSPETQAQMMKTFLSLGANIQCDQIWQY